MLPMLMANAPAPRAYPKEYKDFEVSIVKEESNSSTDYPYAYTYHIKNTGVGYIDSVSITNTHKDKDGYYIHYAYLQNENFNPVFVNAVIEPQAEINVSSPRNKKIDDITDIKWTGQAYFDFADDVLVSGTLAVSKDRGKNAYAVDMSLSGGNKDKYEYGAILKLIYDGNEHFVQVNKFDDFTIVTSEELDLTKLTEVKVMEVTRSIVYGYGCSSNAWNTLKVVAIALFICFLFVVSCGIFCAIFFPIMRKKKRERREKKNEQL